MHACMPPASHTSFSWLIMLICLWPPSFYKFKWEVSGGSLMYVYFLSLLLGVSLWGRGQFN